LLSRDPREVDDNVIRVRAAQAHASRRERVNPRLGFSGDLQHEVCRRRSLRSARRSLFALVLHASAVHQAVCYGLQRLANRVVAVVKNEYFPASQLEHLIVMRENAGDFAFESLLDRLL